MDEHAQVGKRIQRIRKAQKISQERLAELADVSMNYVSRIERGTENPSLDILIRVGRALDMVPYQLLQIDHETERPRQLRKKLERLITKVKDEDLIRTVRILEALVIRRSNFFRKNGSLSLPM